MSSQISLSPALARELLYVRAVHPLVLWGLTDLLDARLSRLSMFEYFNLHTLPPALREALFTDALIDRYAALSADLLVTPTQFMCRHAGARGREIADRYGESPAMWEAFRSRVSLRHPHLPIWQEPVVVGGYTVETLPEIAVYRRFQLLRPKGLEIMIQPPIRELAARGRADFGLYRKGGPTVYVEVVGNATSGGKPSCRKAAAFLPGIAARLARYHGKTPMVPIFLDEVCDPTLQARRVLDAIDLALRV